MKTFLTLFLMLFLSLDVFAAGSDDDNTIVKPRAYKNAIKLIKKEDYSKAVIVLEKILEKKKYQKDPDILNEYALHSEKVVILLKQKLFIIKLLDIDPKHNGALEYLESFMLIQRERTRLTFFYLN